MQIHRIEDVCVRQGGLTIAQLCDLSHSLLLPWGDVHLWQVGGPRWTSLQTSKQATYQNSRLRLCGFPKCWKLQQKLFGLCKNLFPQWCLYPPGKQMQLQDRLFWRWVWWEPLFISWGLIFFCASNLFCNVSQLSLSYFKLKADNFLGAPQLCRPAESQINKRRSCSSFYQCLDSSLSSVSLFFFTFSLIYWCYFHLQLTI